MTDLIQETGGISPGAIYAVDGQRAAMVWSKHWRSDVAEHQVRTHLGIVGQALIVGWPESPGQAPAFVKPRVIAQGLSSALTAEQIQAALIAAGSTKIRRLGTPAPEPTPA